MTQDRQKIMWVPHIDGLRAIAAIVVIVFHLKPEWLPGGFVGVDVFFVISGFVISAAASQRQPSGYWEFVVSFYERRLARIMPALIVCLMATFIISVLFIPAAWLSRTIDDTGFFAFLGLSNFVLANAENSYFSPTSEFNPFTHTWSLAVEEQFYWLFPVLFFPFFRNKMALTISLFAVGTVASFFSAWLPNKVGMQAFYMMWTRFWELGSGVLLFQLMVLRGHSFLEPSGESKVMKVGALLSLIVLCVGLLIARPHAAPVPASVLPLVGTLGLIGFLHGRSSGVVYYLLTHKVMRFLGRLSYSLYLWHWPVFVLLRWTTGLDTCLWRVAAVSLTMAIAAFSYYCVEVPTRRIAVQCRQFVVLAVTLTLTSTGLLAASRVTASRVSLSLSTVMKNVSTWYPEDVRQSAQYPDCRLVTKLNELEGGFVIYQRTGCPNSAKDVGRVFVVGDSHAGMYKRMLTLFVLNRGTEVYLYFVGGCSFLSLHGEPPHCNKYERAVLADLLRRVRPGDIVFLPSLRLPRMCNQWSHFRDSDEATEEILGPWKEARLKLEEEAIQTLTELTHKGAQIVLEAPTPMFDTVPFRCSDWFNSANTICKKGDSIPREAFEAMRRPVLDSFSRMADAVSGVYVWDPLPLLCPTETCRTRLGNFPIVFDGDHLTGFANDILLQSFTEFVTRISK